MRTAFFLFTFFFCKQISAQSIAGLWLSADSSRMYEIRPCGQNSFEAIIKSTTRLNDSAGFIVIKQLQFNSRKKTYEGLMYAVAETRPCFVKITMSDNGLVLKLSRMFLFDVKLRWRRYRSFAFAPQQTNTTYQN